MEPLARTEAVVGCAAAILCGTCVKLLNYRGSPFRSFALLRFRHNFSSRRRENARREMQFQSESDAVLAACLRGGLGVVSIAFNVASRRASVSASE